MNTPVRYLLIGVLLFIHSIAPEIILQPVLHSTPFGLIYVKSTIAVVFLALAYILPVLKPLRQLSWVLLFICASVALASIISQTSLWHTTFSGKSFLSVIGSSVFLKVITLNPLLIALIFVCGSTKRCYLSIGNLNIKAEKIPWLGIPGGKISWGKLSLISGILISTGTILLTLVTAQGLSEPTCSFYTFLLFLPFIVTLALVNSFFEGVLFRNAILGALHRYNSKSFTLISAALFFGVGHYYGIPSGIIGAAMSSLLGWYMCRSMYETGGLVAAWIIHFLQDLVIFSTIFMLGKWG